MFCTHDLGNTMCFSSLELKWGGDESGSSESWQGSCSGCREGLITSGYLIFPSFFC